ncbi:MULTISPECIES: N-acetyltransferase [Bacillales]|uniref:GNAT family N-acetyltransferase n=1 Tax=Bacillales TaxID=1385 RepID=UPI0006A7AAD3|nr:MULTISPECIES: GNAT family N-acetyltransferase [Bacillales]OBZ07675.1 GCN5 family acetyltransferase [Bacillus sp. FJAT-26390]
MIKEIDITNRALAEKMLNIQIPAYKVEAALIDFDEIPPLKDTVDTLLACGETFYGYYIEDELCGAIAIKAEGSEIDIHRLLVHPDHFRKGIAQKLLRYVENLEGDYHTLIVSTGSKNAPAIHLYTSNGFFETGVIEVEERLSLTSFQKKIRRE